MAEAADLVVVAPDGTLRAGGRETERRLKGLAGKYRLVVDAPGMILLRKETGDDPNQGPRVLLSGEIVNRTTVLEIINVIASTNWRGELRLLSGEHMRTMMFDQGVVKHASSDHPDDRLGEVLFRMGVVTRKQLDKLLSEVTPERRFGQLLVDHGIAEREQLFTYLQKQVEQTFFACLLVREGTFVFSTPDEAAVPPSATVHIPAQHLLMEGVQRIDEMALFKERIPHGRLCPEVNPGAPPPKKLDATAQTVLGQTNGSRTIHDIARETGLGEFETTKAIYHLLQQNQIVLRSEPRADDDEVLSLVYQFNNVMRDIFAAVATYGGIDQTRRTVAAWIQGSGYGTFFAEGVEEDGSIDAKRLLAAMKMARIERPIEALHRALHELSAYALFAATSSLPRQQELLLARDVNRRLKAIRI